MAYSFKFHMQDGTVRVELVPDPFIYVARSPEDGEVSASIQSDVELNEFEKGDLIELMPSSGRVLWISRVLL